MAIFRRNMRHQCQRNFLIFLDIDGVLNTASSFNTKYELYDTNIKALKNLVEQLGKYNFSSQIILISTWRLGFDSAFEKCSPQIQKLITRLKEVDLAISGKTVVYKGKTREVEILRYIREYQLKEQEFSYIILDDDVAEYDSKELQKMNFYKVNQSVGLTSTDVEKILRRIE